MKTLVAVFSFLCLFFVAQADAQVTMYYQPTPYPLKKCAGTASCPGGAMPQDLEKIHIWDGWITDTFYGKVFIRDEKLQIGGWGDSYRTYLQFDVNGLPASVNNAWFGLYAYPRGDNSTLVNYDMWTPNSAWSLSMLWGDQPGFTYNSSWGYGSNNYFWWHNRTALYNSWRSGTTNNGITLMSWTQNNNFNVWRSSRYTTNDGQRPILALNFNQPAGMPSFKMPVPGGAKWLLTNEIGGYECMGENPWPDNAHRDTDYPGNYYSIDISPTNVKDAGGSYTGNIPVIAAAAGYVATASYTDANGYYVVIDHDGDGNLNTGYSTRYLHMQSNLAVSQGNTVAQGDLLGYMGNTGNPTTGTHLHFGIRYQNFGYSYTSQLSYAVVDGWLMKSFQTECAVNGSGVPTSRIRYYHSTNRSY